MIITCKNCNKRFNVSSNLIPNEGREIKCGSCNHIWHFIKDNFKGLWFGPGIGYWVNSFETVNRVKGQNNSFVFSLGGGYNITLWKRLYASPWVALHTRFTGVSEKKYGDSKYVPARFTPEVSFKLGWKFGNL